MYPKYTSNGIAYKYAKRWYQYVERKKAQRNSINSTEFLSHGAFMGEIERLHYEKLGGRVYSPDDLPLIKLQKLSEHSKIFYFRALDTFIETNVPTDKRPGISKKVKKFIQGFCRLHFILTHFTSHQPLFDTPDRRLKSLLFLQETNPMGTVIHHNTNDIDLDCLHHDFVFFKFQLNRVFYPGVGLHRSRFGEHSISLPVEETPLLSDGILYFYDLATWKELANPNLHRNWLMGKDIISGLAAAVLVATIDPKKEPRFERFRSLINIDFDILHHNIEAQQMLDKILTESFQLQGLIPRELGFRFAQI